MSLLSFEKPKKVLKTDEHNKIYSSDSNIAGTYVPNMSYNDTLKWKAKHIKGKDERIEIRKTFDCAQMLIVVYKSIADTHDNVQMSSNGKVHMTFELFDEFSTAISEAKEILGVKAYIKLLSLSINNVVKVKSKREIEKLDSDFEGIKNADEYGIIESINPKENKYYIKGLGEYSWDDRFIEKIERPIIINLTEADGKIKDTKYCSDDDIKTKNKIVQDFKDNLKFFEKIIINYPSNFKYDREEYHNAIVIE